MHKLVVVGDIHLQKSEPKCSNALDTLDWIFRQDFNNGDNSLLILGDLCEVNSLPELYEVYVDYFVNKSSFEQIYILQGNHDCVNQSTILSIFRPLPKVKVITSWDIVRFYNCNLLMLPYYNHEGTGLGSMVEVYSHLYENEEIKSTNIDFGFGHLEDATNHFSKKFCDTSKLKVGHWFNGHIHVNDSMNNGNYLGSACMNSVTESGHKRYILEIDGETKEFKHTELPAFMEYYEVEYPNKLEKISTRYGIFLVRNAIDKNLALEEYSRQAEELGFDFYARRVLRKNVKEVEVSDTERTERLTFEDFVRSTKLDNDVADACREVVKLKNEE